MSVSVPHRPRLWRRLAAAAAALSVLALAGAAAATPDAPAAQPDQMPSLPKPGEEFKLELAVEKVLILPSGEQLDSPHAFEDLGGALHLGIHAADAAAPSGPGEQLGVSTMVTEFTLESDLQQQSSIRIELDLDAIADVPPSTLSMGTDFPPTFKHEVRVPLKMTIDPAPPGRATTEAGPLVLETKHPAVLVGEMQQFPPRGHLYQLQAPMELVLPDNPDLTVAAIKKFAIQIGQL